MWRNYSFDRPVQSSRARWQQSAVARARLKTPQKNTYEIQGNVSSQKSWPSYLLWEISRRNYFLSAELHCITKQKEVWIWSWSRGSYSRQRCKHWLFSLVSWVSLLLNCCALSTTSRLPSNSYISKSQRLISKQSNSINSSTAKGKNMYFFGFLARRPSKEVTEMGELLYSLCVHLQTLTKPSHHR